VTNTVEVGARVVLDVLDVLDAAFGLALLHPPHGHCRQCTHSQNRGHPKSLRDTPVQSTCAHVTSLFMGHRSDLPFTAVLPIIGPRSRAKELAPHNRSESRHRLCRPKIWSLWTWYLQLQLIWLALNGQRRSRDSRGD